MLSESNISYKPFWGICRPLNSWRANSPNPIQIYCAKQSKYDYFSTTTAPSLMTLSIFRTFEIASKGFSFKQTKSAFLPTSSVP